MGQADLKLGCNDILIPRMGDIWKTQHGYN